MPDTPNDFISNNIVSNKYITYLCAGTTVEDHGEQAFYIRCRHVGRQLYRPGERNGTPVAEFPAWREYGTDFAPSLGKDLFSAESVSPGTVR